MPQLAGPCLTIALMLGVAALPVLAGQKPSSRPRTEFVELDAVVMDSNDRPVRVRQPRRHRGG